jgi:hypothetical protein
MRSAFLAILLGASALSSSGALAQDTAPLAPTAQSEGPADLCRELLAYTEKRIAPRDGSQASSGAPAGAPAPNGDRQAAGTQGGGSVDGTSLTDTRKQRSAPATAPVASGAAPEAAASPHATDSATYGKGASPDGADLPKYEFMLAGGITVQQVRDVVQQADRQACRDVTQKLRRAGAGLPAELIALAAYEPDPAKRK